MPDKQRRAMFASMRKGGIQGYDVQAKRKVRMENPKIVVMKNRMLAWEGISPATGNKVFRIIGKK